MARPVTLFSGQWTDLPFEKFCEKAKSFGYEGVEIACSGDHLDLEKAADDLQYVEDRKNILKNYDLKVTAIGTHFIGRCIGESDTYLNPAVPSKISGKPEEIRKWAVEQMKLSAAAAKNLGLKIVTGTMGNPIWANWYNANEKMIDEAYKKMVDLWSPIFDEFDKNGVKFALEVQPEEIAFDYYTAERLIKEFKSRKTLGFNFNPAHFIWQGILPHLFVRDFSSKIIHVCMKDISVNLDGRAGLLGSYFSAGEVKRAWNFCSLGHGNVDFENIIRELNAVNYKGALSVEWEDTGMNRELGAKEACIFLKGANFSPLDTASDNGKAEG